MSDAVDIGREPGLHLQSGESYQEDNECSSFHRDWLSFV